MDNRFNTIAGWVLGGGIVLLGSSLVFGELFKPEHSETRGYPIPGVVVDGDGDGGAEETPIAARLQTADAAAGEAVFRRCQTCHTINQGGPNQSGPNLWGVMGGPLGHAAGFAYSNDLRAKGGTWTWEAMDEWIANPRRYIPGTKMGFAGIADGQDRANLLAYLNAQGGSLQIPPPPTNADTPAEAAAENAAATAGNGVAPETPDATGAPKGEGAPETSGRDN